MKHFNNVRELHLSNDRKNAYATFSSESDALLALNTLNEREIAGNYFTANIESLSKSDSNPSSKSPKKISTYNNNANSSDNRNNFNNKKRDVDDWDDKDVNWRNNNAAHRNDAASSFNHYSYNSSDDLRRKKIKNKEYEHYRRK